MRNGAADLQAMFLVTSGIEGAVWVGKKNIPEAARALFTSHAKSKVSDILDE
jgi:hypothetical protein